MLCFDTNSGSLKVQKLICIVNLFLKVLILQIINIFEQNFRRSKLYQWHMRCFMKQV